MAEEFGIDYVRVSATGPQYLNRTNEECLGDYEARAWSSPIYVDYTR